MVETPIDKGAKDRLCGRPALLKAGPAWDMAARTYAGATYTWIWWPAASACPRSPKASPWTMCSSFSRAGFTESAQAFAHERGARLVTLTEVEAAHIRFVGSSAS